MVMVTKGKPASTPAAGPRPLNGINHHHPSHTGALNGLPNEASLTSHANLTPSCGDAAPDMQAPAEGQANPQETPHPSGEAPADEEFAKQQEEQLLAKAKDIRSLRATLDIAVRGPWAEPEQPMSHWDFLLKEMHWLAVDVFQERLWKKAIARKLSLEAAAFDCNARLLPTEGNFGAEVRELKRKAAAPKEDTGRRSKKGARDRWDCSQAPATLKEDLASSTESSFCYQAHARLSEAVEQQLRKAADRAAIAQELRIREYELQYEKSLQEARELAILARRQIAAELRGRDDTPAGDFDEEVKKNKRKRPRISAYDEIMNGDLLPPPAKRPSNLRKQQLSHSRPDSGVSEDNRNLESDAVNSLPAQRLRRKKKIRDYDDDDYEDTLRSREAPRIRRPPPNSTVGRSLRSDATKQRKKSLTSTRQGSRVLDPEALLAWSQLDDNLLCSIVHEFGSNWKLVADIFATSCSLSGIHRNASQCLKRFRELAMPYTPDGQEVQEQVALDALRINKNFARDLIAKTLPVPEAVVQAHQKILLDIGKEYRDKRLKTYQSDREAGLILQEPHESVLAVEAEALRANRGRVLTPLQVVENSDAQQKAIAAQHLASQQQQAAQQNAQQQAAAAAAAAAPVGPGMSGGVAVSGGNTSGGYAESAAPVVQQAGGSPLQQMQAPMPQGMQNGPVGMGKPAGSLPNGQTYALPQGQPMPPPSSMGQAQPRNLHLQIQQLQHILTTGKMPRGEDLTPEMRQSIMNRLRDYQRLQAQSNPGRGGGPPMMGVQRQLPSGGMRPIGMNQGLQPRIPAQMPSPGMPAHHQMQQMSQGMTPQQGVGQPGQAQGGAQMGLQSQPGQGMAAGQIPYQNQSPQQLQAQRPAYPSQMQANPSQGPGPYGNQMQSPHIPPTQPQYPGQTLGSHANGHFSSQMQNTPGHIPQAVGSPTPQLPGQSLQQNGQTLPGQYGVSGHAGNHLQPRQGLGQMSNQIQDQYSSPMQSGTLNQMAPGVQGQQHGSWNPRMHVANPHTAPGIQPGLNYHAQAGMNPALAQAQGRPQMHRPQQPGISQHGQAPQ